MNFARRDLKEAHARARGERKTREETERKAAMKVSDAEKTADERVSKAEAAFQTACQAAEKRCRVAEEASAEAQSRADEYLAEVERLSVAYSTSEVALAEALSRLEAAEDSLDDRAKNLRAELESTLKEKSRDAENDIESAVAKAYRGLGKKVEAVAKAEQMRSEAEQAKVEHSLELSESSRQEAAIGMDFWQARAIRAERILQAIEKGEEVVELLFGAAAKNGKHRALGKGPELREFLVQGSRGVLSSDVDISSHPIRSNWKHKASDNEIYVPPGLPIDPQN